MEIAGDLPSSTGMLAAAAQTRPNVVVLGVREARLPDDCRSLLEAFPRVRVLAVVDDGRRAFVYELRPQETALGEVSPEGLLDAIRRPPQRPVAPTSDERAL